MLTTHQLFGDPAESFYQLGLKDKAAYAPTFVALENFLKISPGPLNKIQQGPRQLFAKHLLKKFSGLKMRSEAYAEGLGITAVDFLSALLIPEFLSSLHFWPSGGVFSLLGCSSLFALDEVGRLLHGRILDFPLVGSYDQGERVLKMKSPGQQSIVSLGTAGLPYPSLTAMNESGMTMALHQKYSNFFHPKGEPIFEIIYGLMLEGHDKRSAWKYLKDKQSLSSWGLYLGFVSGEVLAVDLMGTKVHREEFTLEPGQALYFNNLMLKQREQDKKILPLGVQEYCKMRARSFHKIWEEKKERPMTEKLMLEILASGQPLAGPSAKNWTLTPRTPFSLSISVMNPSEALICALPGAAPKSLNGELLRIDQLWKNLRQSNEKMGGRPVPLDYSEGLTHYALAQKFLDAGDHHLVFHHIQLAAEKWAPYAEAKVAQFFLLALQYLHMGHQRQWGTLLEKFRLLAPHLPAFLADHARLMIARIEKILGLPRTIQESELGHPSLRALFHWEQKLSVGTLKLYRHLTFLRLDLLDLIYIYAPSPESKRPGPNVVENVGQLG